MPPNMPPFALKTAHYSERKVCVYGSLLIKLNNLFNAYTF